jgi:two-component system OmpR family sensor kinase
MSEAAAPVRTRRSRAPFGLQLVLLLVVCLVAAQAISFAVIVLMPPPRPPIYHAADVANALRGGSLKMRFARPLTRETVDVLPADLNASKTERERERFARTLAQTLGVDDARVRVVQPNPLLQMRMMRWVHRMEQRPPAFDRPPVPGDPGRGPGDPGRMFGSGGPPDGWPHFGGFPGGREIAIAGDFAAARQLDDGHWVVVRSTPEPFPTDWQLRTALWLLAGFLVVAPAGWLFARRITAPLKRFAEAAETLGRDPHAPQMTLTGPAEIGAAAHAFNEMQTRLRRYIDDRTAMVGAISHDLRTPLARIKFKVEAASPHLRDSVLSDIDQMEQMIGGVLAFIRDEGRPRQRERLDLLSLVECVADDAAMLGGDVEVEEDSEPVTVDGDPVALQRLFGNLVNNAVKYGGGARIQVRREGPLAAVAIADTGPGLAPDELERVFLPFYRSDVSRNLDKGGVGLGLPIARSAARAHGGDVELTSPGQGVTALVTLPLAP